MSQRDSTYERKPFDLYETPEWVTMALMEDIGGRHLAAIWEPAAASGKMSGALRAFGHRVFESDIQHPTPTDFLSCYTRPDPLCHTIITNPPYGPRGTLARAFIERALDLTEPVRGVVAMLLRVDYDSAKTRACIFGNHPAFARKLVLRRRINWFGKSKSGSSENHSWFIWDWANDGDPTIGYAP